MLSAALAAFLSLCLLFAGSAQAWLATSYYEESLSEYTYSNGYTTSTRTYTDLQAVKPTVTSFSTISVDTSTDYYDDDLTVVNVLIPTGVASAITAYDYDYYNYNTDTTYYAMLAWSAPTGCATTEDWVWATEISVDVPAGVTPTPLSMSTSEYEGAGAFAPTTTYTYAILNPTDVPSSTLSYYSSYLERNYSWLTLSCTVPSYQTYGIVSSNGVAVTPTSTPTGASSTRSAAAAATTTSSAANRDYSAHCAAKKDSSSSSGYYSGSSISYHYDYDGLGIGYYTFCDKNYSCRCFHGLRWWEFIIVIIFSWVGFILLIGCIESWFTFRSLCRGRSARRGVPIAFCLLMFPWSCFFLCCSKRGFNKKSPTEQEEMVAAWKVMGFWKKIGRWLKWGFRYKYPSFLGPAPFRRTKWEEKDIAREAHRRLSVNEAMVGMGATGPQQGGGVVPVGAGAPVSSYYAPNQMPMEVQRPEGAYGVQGRDFAQPQQAQSPRLPPRPATENVAGPAPSAKGKEVVRGELPPLEGGSQAPVETSTTTTAAPGTAVSSESSAAPAITEPAVTKPAPVKKKKGLFGLRG